MLKFSDLYKVLYDFDFQEWEKFISCKFDEELLGVDPIGIEVVYDEMILVVDVEFTNRLDRFHISISEILKEIKSKNELLRN